MTVAYHEAINTSALFLNGVASDVVSWALHVILLAAALILRAARGLPTRTLQTP